LNVNVHPVKNAGSLLTNGILKILDLCVRIVGKGMMMNDNHPIDFMLDCIVDIPHITLLPLLVIAMVICHVIIRE